MLVDMPEMLPVDGHLIGNPNKAATGSYHLRPFGRPLIEGFFGGRLAHELEAGGPGAFFDFAVAELVELFGSGIRARSPKPAGGAILLREDPILTRFPAMRTHVSRSPRLGMEEFFCRSGVPAARFHDGARRLSDRYRSRRPSDRAEAPRDLTLDGVLAPPRVP
jgi:hypothetical protein